MTQAAFRCAATGSPKQPSPEIDLHPMGISFRCDQTLQSGLTLQWYQDHALVFGECDIVALLEKAIAFGVQRREP